MKQKLISLLLVGSMMFALTACGSAGESGTDEGNKPGSNAGSDVLVEGKFEETRHITVEVYDRGNDGGSDPTNNIYTDYIKKGMLEDHNVEVEFVAVPRWTEVDEINNLLAAGDAPDICVTYSYPTVQTYANMGGVMDMAPFIENYREHLPNLWNWLEETNLYYNKVPETGSVYAIEAKLAINNSKLTFVRRDWLEKLNLPLPTTTEEFYNTIVAFRDNAELLLGADAKKMIPYSVSFDVGWRAAMLLESFMDPNMSDKDYYVHGFDDRKITEPGVKEGVRVLNQWFNEGLLWNDFALYGSGDTTEDDMMKAGYVGAFSHNWDYPFRNGEDSINASLQRMVGEDAAFVAVNCFTDKNGTTTKFVSAPVDRKVFFPTTNDEPLASMLYLDWISDPAHIEYLQIGEEGINHTKMEDGAIANMPATGAAIMNSGSNIDYTITCNGMHLQDEENIVRSIAYSYASADPEIVADAYAKSNVDLRVAKNVQVGEILAETGVGTQLASKRDIVYDLAVAAPEGQFDAIWDSNFADYMNMGGQAIIDERTQKWEATFGDITMLP